MFIHRQVMSSMIYVYSGIKPGFFCLHRQVMCDNSVFSIFPPAPAQGTVTVCEQHGGLLSSLAQSKQYKKVRRLLLLLLATTFNAKTINH